MTDVDEASDSDFDPDAEYDQWPRKQNHHDNDTNASNESEIESDDGHQQERSGASEESSNVLSKLTRNFIDEIHEIMETHNDANYKNALEMNKEMQKKLTMVRSQIQTLLSKIACRYAENEERLIDTMSTKKERKNDGIFGKRMKGLTFYIRGNTFFKDENLRNCPNNDDYRQRLKNNEIFPMDFDLVARHIWSINDKMSIVRGIKEQIISEKSLQIRITNKNTQIATLLETVGNDFKIDWEEISSHHLKYRHSPSSCKAMWEVYLQPSLKHDKFSTAENESLSKAVQKYNFQNWGAIAKEVGRRSDYQCFLQYHTTLHFRKNWLRWDKKDDNCLLEAIEESKCNGVVNWSQVAFKFPQKSKAALQQRYKYAINPAISHELFSPEEDMLLLAAVQEYGTNFAKFPRTLFPNRSVIQLRSRYQNSLQHRHKNKPWTLEDDEYLLEFVKENGTSSWKKLEDLFDGRHTRISCRQRYYVIEKHLKKNPNVGLDKLVRRDLRYVRSDITSTNWQSKIEDLRNNPTSLQTINPKAKKRKTNTKSTNKPLEDKTDQNDAKPPKRAPKRKRHCLAENEKISEEDESEAAKKVLSATEIAELCAKSVTQKSANKTQELVKPLHINDGVEYRERKIKEHRQAARKARQTKKPIYVERLRANGLRFHNFFKYSYNFRFGRSSVINFTEYTNEIVRARDCLGFQMQSDYNFRSYTASGCKEQNMNGFCTPVGRRQGIRQLLCDSLIPGKALEPTDCQIPPNFSTLTTLRALCALSANYTKIKERKSTADANNDNHNDTVAPLPIAEEHLTALNRFRQRFRNLFYQTAVLSRLPPSSLVDQNEMDCSTNAAEVDSITRFPRSIEGLQVVKNELSDDNESFTTIIKTEMDFEPYTETS